MGLRTFTADNLSDALIIVKRELGRDAVLLHTRVITRRFWLGLRRKELVEVTACPASMAPTVAAKRQARSAPSSTQTTAASILSAAQAVIDENRAARVQPPQDRFAPAAAYSPPPHAAPAYAAPAHALQAYATQSSASAIHSAPLAASNSPASNSATSYPAQAVSGQAFAGQSFAAQSTPGQSVNAQGPNLLNHPSVSPAVLAGMSQELQQIKSLVKGLVTEVRSTAPAGLPSANCPEELFDFYKSLIENQVAESIAKEIITTLRSSLRPEQLRQPHIVRAKVLEKLEQLIPVSGGLRRTKHAGPHVVALIGPTGVGKTTTLAKLAANLQLREGRKVGLITIDTYRIAAVDQLRRYADILGSQLKVVSSPEDLSAAVSSMSDHDYILIDTAGRSPKDTLRIGELSRYLHAAAADEVHLVLSATSSQQCIDLAVERFSAARVDRVLFTKLDEAAHVGVILNVARRINKQLSFITTGQDVPNDIEPSRSRRLAEMMMPPDAASGAASNITSSPGVA